MRQTQGVLRQRGQALVFILAFAAATGLAVLLLFNSGKLANTKTDLQNAADAGAYAAATLQARDHNFSAYTNRAMIANQVAVAQLVSLKSYIEDADETQQRMKFPFPFELWYELFPTNKTGWDRAKDIPVARAKSIIDGLAPAAIQGLDALINALMQAQDIYHIGTMTNMMRVANEVVQQNDPNARVTQSTFMLGNAVLRVNAWGNDYSKNLRANTNAAEADRFADVVLDDGSQDGFSRNRDGIPSAMWNSSVNLPMCLTIGATPFITSTNTFFNFVHTGGTILSSDKKRWLALDATLGNGLVSCTFITSCGIFRPICTRRTTIPLMDVNLRSPGFLGGSGGAVAGTGGDYGTDLRGYRGNDLSTWAYGGAALATPSGVYRFTAEGPGATLDSSGGLQDYYRDIDPGNRPANQSAELNGGQYPVTVEVERPVNASLRLSSTLFPGATRIRLNDAARGRTLRAVASGYAYFYRPRDNGNEFTRNGWRRSDGKTEIANLFSPYWQPRLTATPAADSAASIAAQ